MTTKYDYCKDIANLHINILGTGIIQDGRLVASSAKPEAPQPPSEEKLAFMFAQAYLLVEIPKTNEDFFGKVKYTMIEHDRLHVFLFPVSASENDVNDNDSKSISILFVIAGGNYVHEELISKVLDFLKFNTLEVKMQ